MCISKRLVGVQINVEGYYQKISYPSQELVFSPILPHSKTGERNNLLGGMQIAEGPKFMTMPHTADSLCNRFTGCYKYLVMALLI